MEEPITKEPLLSPVLRWFMAAMVLANISGNMAVMLIPLSLDELGASITQIGLVFTILAVISLVTQVFGGWISDLRFNRPFESHSDWQCGRCDWGVYPGGGANLAVVGPGTGD